MLRRWFSSCPSLLKERPSAGIERATSEHRSSLFPKNPTQDEPRRKRRDPLKRNPKSNRELPRVKPFHMFQPNRDLPFSRSIEKTSSALEYSGVEVPNQPPVPILAHNLDRVLFSPGVHFLKDPRTGVYNFTPYLENVMSIKDFDFDSVAPYVPSGKDQTLANLTKARGKKYSGSTSSMTSILCHFHFLLSHNRPPHTMHLSKFFPGDLTRFTETQKKPVSVFLRYNPHTNTHSIDSDGSMSDDIIVSILGHQLEAMLTTPETVFESYRKSNNTKNPPISAANTYNYTECDKFLMRSQLDCYDDRLPGSGFFDLKTRAVCAVRHDMDYAQINDGTYYMINKLDGEFESYAREWFELIRSTMLKYSLQARIGRMDGIFVAYHNIRRIFGFQYVPLSEMDKIFHSGHLIRDRINKKDAKSLSNYIQLDDAMAECASIIADAEFKLSISFLGDIFDKIIQSHDDKTASFNVVFHSGENGKMNIFVKPMLDPDIATIQSTGTESWDKFAKEPVGTRHDEFCDPWTIWQHAKQNPDELPPDTKVYSLNIRTFINDQLIQFTENPALTSKSDEWKVQAELTDLRPSLATEVFSQVFAAYNFDANRITSTPRTERLEPLDESELISKSLNKLAPPTARQELMRYLSEKGKRLEAQHNERNDGKAKVVWFPKPLDSSNN